MTYQEARVYLDEVSKYGSVLGLDVIRNLLAELGNPQEDLYFIHIAGTNGKGSVLAYTSTVLSEAGYRTGRYISPSVTSYLERIQVDAEWISEDAFAELTEVVKDAALRLQAKGENGPTVFEIETAIAFLYFKRQNCDLVVLETGLGGLEDATNIVRNTVAAVFAQVSRDHMSVLGSSLQEIAKQKAGIIKPGCSVVTLPQKAPVRAVLEEEAQKHKCPVYEADIRQIQRGTMDVWGQEFSYRETGMIHLSLSGTFQAENAALACEVIHALRDKGYSVTNEALRKGLEGTRWPGRFSCIGRDPLFLVDGAHNEDAAMRLKESIEICFPGRRLIGIMGVYQDKEYEKIAAIVASMADCIYTVNLPDKERTLSAGKLKTVAEKYCRKAEAAGDIKTAVEKAYQEAGKEDVILAFGSLSYLGQVKQIVETRKKIPDMDREKIRQGIRLLLEGIGEDINREGLRETPERIARMYEEIYGGMRQNAEEHLTKTFHTDNNEMVVEKDITFYSTCEHHMLPFYGKAHIAYIPNGEVVGLSKLARTVEVYAKRLQIQEQLTAQIADALMKYLRPKGVMVMLEAEHLCMTMRGIKKPGSRTVTVVKRGAFLEEKKLTDLFFQMVNR